MRSSWNKFFVVLCELSPQTDNWQIVASFSKEPSALKLRWTVETGNDVVGMVGIGVSYFALAWELGAGTLSRLNTPLQIAQKRGRNSGRFGENFRNILRTSSGLNFRKPIAR